ncbi:hypothetical protein [Sphingomonas lenta]|uniref:Uncharacterized protein n=1 Tax=Sphingomonas lenta TaxID=1141887 RepID=A0A2A2SIH0_9SPHN|nr:hypothetical protein [Sphingomonas lenta]PAX09018.1 hypothetical protein CKY28_06705 [Sphingomonas lenta]
MSENEDVTMEVPAEVERLGGLLARAARSRSGLIASALAVWERANPDRPVAALLGCGDEALWRVAVTPRPGGRDMAAQAQRIAAELGVNVMGLLNILRFAETTARFETANDDGELLMAALDAEDDGEGDDR